jgi:hypothetical protein
VITTFLVVIEPAEGAVERVAGEKYLPVGEVETVAELAEQLLALSHAFTQ